MILSSTDYAGGFEARVDVCVVGSGAGGGLAAGLLAEAGREVLVLEEGASVPDARMSQREEQMYPLLYRDGGNQYTADGAVSVLQGRTLGGSTVINMSDVTPIPDGVLAHWRAHFGLSRYGDAAVRAAEEACAEAMFTTRVPEALLNRNARLLLAGGEALGISGAPFEHNRRGCVGSGYCLVGCAYGAKMGTAKVWIPRALATGRAQVRTDTRATFLDVQQGQVRAVLGDVLHPTTHQPLAPFKVVADHVILAAGAIHSPLLLLASGLGGRAVGRNLSLQPQSPVAAVFPDEVIAWRGVPQGAYLDGRETATEKEGLGGFRVEAVSGTPGMWAISTPGWGDAWDDAMAMARRTGASLCLVPDRPVGRVQRSRQGRPRISWSPTREWAGRMRDATSTAARAYLAAGAESVRLPFLDAPQVTRADQLDALDDYPVRANSLTLISAHPQGTCRMGSDPASSVVAPDLRVHGVRNLQVLDASVFPTTSSSHTMLPVMAFAMLGAQELL